MFHPLPDDKNSSLVKIESFCRRQNKYDLKQQICLSQDRKLCETSIFAFLRYVLKRRFFLVV